MPHASTARDLCLKQKNGFILLRRRAPGRADNVQSFGTYIIWRIRISATGSPPSRQIGELKIINGAEPKEEIGGIVDLYQRKMGNPAVMFDEVPGFPKGHACSPTS